MTSRLTKWSSLNRYEVMNKTLEIPTLAVIMLDITQIIMTNIIYRNYILSHIIDELTPFLKIKPGPSEHSALDQRNHSVVISWE